MLKEFVEYVVKQLVDDKDAVVITQRQEDAKLFVEIHVASQDLGKVIGKGGTTVRSLRSIAAVIGSQQGVDVILEIAK